jgi:G3E family GTPase
MSLPLTVIGGYLGAGKTTLLNRMLTGDHGRRIAVIVNDFGALNVDASLVASHAGDTIALSNGCICCSASDGTGEAIARILARRGEFDHIVIEASGVAEPGKVARNAAAFRLPLDGVIVLADAEQLPDQVANRYTGRSVIAQLRQADLVVINKIDLADADRLSETRAVVERHAPSATIVMTERARLPLAVLFGARPSERGSEDPAVYEPEVHHSGSYAAALIERPAMSREAFEEVARDLSSGTIRAKGHVVLTDAPAVRHLYQQVGRRWTLVEDGGWGAGEPVTRIVTIAVRETVPQA